jgi:hypothetical protein
MFIEVSLLRGALRFRAMRAFHITPAAPRRTVPPHRSEHRAEHRS